MDRPIRFELMALAGFTSMASMRMCDAMLPALGASFGVSAAAASASIGAFAIAYGLLQLVYGPLGDRYGKPLVVGCATLSCCAGAVLAACAPDLAWLVFARVLMGAAAGGIIPLTMAWIGDNVTLAGRQVALSRLLTYTICGQVAGTWGGGLMAEHLGWRWAFAVLAVCFVAIGTGVVRSAGRARPERAANAQGFMRNVRMLLANPWARRLYAMTLAEGALIFGVVAFLPNTLHERHGLSLGAAGGVVALFAVGGVLYSRLVGRLVARMPRYRIAFTGGCIVGASFIGFAAMPHWQWAILLCPLAGFGLYMLHNTLQTLATQLSDTARGTAVALFASVLFMGQSIGVAAGAFAAARQWVVAGMVAAAVAVFALAAILVAQVRAFDTK